MKKELAFGFPGMRKKEATVLLHIIRQISRRQPTKLRGQKASEVTMLVRGTLWPIIVSHDLASVARGLASHC